MYQMKWLDAPSRVEFENLGLWHLICNGHNSFSGGWTCLTLLKMFFWNILPYLSLLQQGQSSLEVSSKGVHSLLSAHPLYPPACHDVQLAAAKGSEEQMQELEQMSEKYTCNNPDSCASLPWTAPPPQTGLQNQESLQERCWPAPAAPGVAVRTLWSTCSKSSSCLSLASSAAGTL